VTIFCPIKKVANGYIALYTARIPLIYFHHAFNGTLLYHRLYFFGANIFMLGFLARP